jgi:pyruvate formate lyase activating enzyme
MLIPENHLLVHSIESFGTHDGPGVRLVIFLQGCNLKCNYCQNPDALDTHSGKLTPFEELLDRAVNMKSYFGKNGGVTISGGEPLMQSRNLIKFLEALKGLGIHTNIDTNGTVRSPFAMKIISQVADLVMFDIKHTTRQGFKSITGVDHLTNVLENIQLREENELPYWIRYVLVPGYTDSEESLSWLIETSKALNHITKFEVLPYHKLGVHKWLSLQWEYELNDVREHTSEQLVIVKNRLGEHIPNLTIR